MRHIFVLIIFSHICYTSFSLKHISLVGPNPIPTEDVCAHFNELRSDMVLLYELKLALANCEFELQTLRHQTESLTPEKAKDNPDPVPSTPLLSASEIKQEP